MTNPACKKSGTLLAYRNKARRYLYSMAPGPGAELLLLIVIVGVALWALR